MFLANIIALIVTAELAVVVEGATLLTVFDDFVLQKNRGPRQLPHLAGPGGGVCVCFQVGETCSQPV